MARTYKVNSFVRISNAIAAALLRAGVKVGPNVLLTVNGRTSGLPRTTPVALLELDGQRLLVAPFGEVNWVRNLRAAGEAVITRGRNSESVRVVELTPKEAAPILKRGLQSRLGAVFGGPYFDVTPEASLEDFEREAPRHPVFVVQRFA